jgi:hypothetical protein
MPSTTGETLIQPSAQGPLTTAPTESGQLVTSTESAALKSEPHVGKKRRREEVDKDIGIGIDRAAAHDVDSGKDKQAENSARKKKRKNKVKNAGE